MWEPQELLRQQYAAVGSAAIASLTETVASPENLGSKNGDALPLIGKCKQRTDAANRYADLYRRYRWQAESVNDLKQYKGSVYFSARGQTFACSFLVQFYLFRDWHKIAFLTRTRTRKNAFLENIWHNGRGVDGSR